MGPTIFSIEPVVKLNTGEKTAAFGRPIESRNSAFSASEIFDVRGPVLLPLPLPDLSDEELTAFDEGVGKAFQGFPESPFLENRILVGLRHQRSKATAHSSVRKWWVLLPVLACLMIVCFLLLKPRWQQYRLSRQVAILLSKPPELQIRSTDRHELLQWSSDFVSASSTLPPELDRVHFQGAATVTVANHKAVFLKMRYEGRASLLVVDAPLTKDKGFHAIKEDSGSASLWSDGKRSFVLLFNGNEQEIHTYMAKMGISA